MNKPEPMTDQVLESAHYKHAKYQEESMRASGWFEYAEAIIAARDAQWEQMLAAQEPVAWIEHLAGALQDDDPGLSRWLARRACCICWRRAAAYNQPSR